MIRTPITAVLAAVLLDLATLPAPALAYLPVEVNAIVSNRPESLPPSCPGIVLASQRLIRLSAGGGAMKEDHLFEVVGAGRPAGPLRIRWTYRPGIEEIKTIDARVYRLSGEISPIPADSIRTEPCFAAGPKGYPGISDFVVAIPDPVPGDLVEIHTSGMEAPMMEPQYYAGEEHFAEADSVVEAELSIRFPTVLPLLTWRLGDIPEPDPITHGTTFEAHWLLGHLSPAGTVHRALVSHVVANAPDSLGPSGVLFGYRNTWSGAVFARAYLWKRALRESPPELVTAAHEILGTTQDPGGRADSAIAWVNRRLERVDIPTARLWYAPARLQAVLDRGAAIPRDRAAVLVWLLQRVGVGADAAMVRSHGRFIADLAFPQQLDAWVVRARLANGAERWIDMRPPDVAARDSLQAGQAVLWTARGEDDPLVPFPGVAR